MISVTTIEARNAMRACGLAPIYTNRTAGYNGRNRRVKAYMPSSGARLEKLRELVGKENVTVTPGGLYLRREGVTVKCKLA